MLCQKCGVNNATTHIHSIVNGIVNEIHLCGTCAAGEGYGDIKSKNLSQMLSSMFGDTAVNTAKSKVTRCDCCGSTFADIAKSGKCGCGKCYTTFYEQLLPYFKRVHGSIQHIGKAPNNNFLSKNESKETVGELRAQLCELVKQENYEQAAVIRDKIKELQGDML